MAESGNESKIIEEIETFKKRLYDLEYAIDPRADNLRYVDSENRNLGSLSDVFSKALIAYQENRTNPEGKMHAAITLQAVIAKLYANGVIINQKSIQEIESFKEQNKQLKEEYDALELKYQHVVKDYAVFKRRANKYFGGEGEVDRR